jgi:hypothetical protein
VQNFVALLGNTLVSGLLAPALGFSLTALAAGSFGYTIIGALLWRRHLATTPVLPHGSPDAPAFEPID